MTFSQPEVSTIIALFENLLQKCCVAWKTLDSYSKFSVAMHPKMVQKCCNKSQSSNKIIISEAINYCAYYVTQTNKCFPKSV